MTQVHRRFPDEQARNLFRTYAEGYMQRSQVEEILEVSKTRFFALVKLYRKDPRCFSLANHRGSPLRLSKDAEILIRKSLFEDRAMIEDPSLPVSSFNCSAIREQLQHLGFKVSLPTIVNGHAILTLCGH